MNFKFWKVRPPRSLRRVMHELRKNPPERFVIPNS